MMLCLYKSKQGLAGRCKDGSNQDVRRAKELSQADSQMATTAEIAGRA